MQNDITKYIHFISFIDNSAPEKSECWDVLFDIKRTGGPTK